MRRPWNIINTPVYSLSTFSDGRLNMNVCTYVTAISRRPKMYAIAIEYGTQTFFNLEKSDDCVLQLLSVQQIELVSVLGKKSGINYDKEKFLKKRGALSQWKTHTVLSACSAYLYLEKVEKIMTGDHFLYLFRVKGSQTMSGDNILMFQDLIRERIILG